LEGVGIPVPAPSEEPAICGSDQVLPATTVCSRTIRSPPTATQTVVPLSDSSATTWLPHIVSEDPLTGALAPAPVGPMEAVGPLALSTVGAPAAQAAVEVDRARLMSTRATRVMAIRRAPPTVGSAAVVGQDGH
jgi:hypothetical protein